MILCLRELVLSYSGQANNFTQLLVISLQKYIIDYYPKYYFKNANMLLFASFAAFLRSAELLVPIHDEDVLNIY